MCGSGTLAWSFSTTPISWEQSDTHCHLPVGPGTGHPGAGALSGYTHNSQVKSRLSSAGGTATTVMWSHAEVPGMTRDVKDPYNNNMPSQPGLPLM